MASDDWNNSDESTTVYELFRVREYKKAFHVLSQINSTGKDCLFLALSFFTPLIPPLLVIATLFLFSAHGRLSSTFCNTHGMENVFPTLKAMIIVVLLAFSLPHFIFNPLSKNYIEKVCLSVYLYDKRVGTSQEYFLSNLIALFLIPIYYMKKNRISIRSLFIINKEKLKLILPYILKGAVALLLLNIAIAIIYIIYSTASPAVSAGSGTKVMHRSNLMDAIRASDFYLKIYAALIGPFFEEICFRGMVFLLLRKHFKTYISIIFSALFFLSFPSHLLTLTAMLTAFGSGVIYAALVHRTNSLWPSILLHVAWNSRVFL